MELNYIHILFRHQRKEPVHILFKYKRTELGYQRTAALSLLPGKLIFGRFDQLLEMRCNKNVFKWNVSAAGFGCYRVSADVNDHATAMTRAMMHGINLIDTSTNYTDGASERLVGQVLESLVHEKRLQREQVLYRKWVIVQNL
jgi:hypothetical protein